MAAKRKKTTTDFFMNPVTGTTTLLVLGTVAALGIGYAVVKARRRATAKKGRTTSPEAYLSGYFVPGATLGASPMIISDMDFGVQPFYLSEAKVGAPIGLRNPATGEITFLSEARFANTDDLATLVTNLHGDKSYELYDVMLASLVDASRPPPETVAADVLARFRPAVEWYSLEGFAADSPEQLTLQGARILAELGKQNLENKGLL